MIDSEFEGEALLRDASLDANRSRHRWTWQLSQLPDLFNEQAHARIESSLWHNEVAATWTVMRHACTNAIDRYTYGMSFGLRLYGPEKIQSMFRHFAKQQWLGIIGTDLPYPVFGRFVTTSDGRRLCTALLFGAPESKTEIRPRHLRRVPLAQVMIQANRPDSPLDFLLDSGPRLSGRYKPGRPGPAGHDDAHYDQVVAEWREALRSSKTPIKRVARRLGRSASTVHRWLNEAEDRGKLQGLPKRRRGKP